MTLSILPFRPEYAPLFDRLNRAWISELFTIEPFDDLVLTRPEEMIIKPGGEIWFAGINEKPVGCAALIPFSPTMFEFTKLGVDENARGLGAARALLRHCIERARHHGTPTLRIFTNSRLVPACALYRSEGFIQQVMSEDEQRRYQRADLMFDLAL
jgi:GNAT superfamily N-acetyltransferase